MHVAIDASNIGSGLGGDETMARALVRALVSGAQPDDRLDVLLDEGATLEGDRVVLRSGGPGDGAGLIDGASGVGGGATVVVSNTPRRGGSRHFLRELPRWVASLRPRPDLFLSFTHAPIRCSVPVALMVPDLSFEHLPGAFPRSTRVRLRALVRRQAASARGVLTISGFCRADLVSTYGLAPDRVHHVPLHAEPPGAAPLATAEAEVRRRLGIEGRFVLYLGNLHPRKNLGVAIEAVALARTRHRAMADHTFVVAGATWWGDPDDGGAARRSAPDGVRFVGRVSDEDRHVLLAAADALVYPSRFEGFGLPPLEAMARDTPVVASNVTSIPEICGDAALLVGPDDVEAMADALAAATTDRTVRAGLIRAGRARIEHYSPARTTAALWEALHAMADRPLQSRITAAGRR